MEPNFTSRRKMRGAHSRDGIALVLVLAFLVLLTVLVVAFFTSVTTERAASSNYARGVNVKQLADSAVQTVMGTIRTATSRGSNIAWASQPGMIRTYGTNTTASGDPLAYYKLYSSSNMVATANLSGYKPETDPADVGGNMKWDQESAFFTDLNEPVVTTNPNSSISVYNYPIVDPIKDTTAPVYNPANPPADPPTDPASPTALPVSGFGVYNVPLSTSTTGFVNPIPMPVRWLYQLKDGTLTAPDDPTGPATLARFINSPPEKQPTSKNPIVGRIAFWTDDETSKVNINTSAGDLSLQALNYPTTNATGSFWDTPRVDSPVDKYMVTTQAVTNEYQRYPGHPSTISLNAIFRNLGRDDIGTIAPRILSGNKGSAGGTIQTSPTIDQRYDSNNTLKPDQDRLYASVDELMFRPTLSGAVRDLNPVPNPDPIAGTSDLVSKRRFFLTANSRAPETTLFGTPRIGIWPLSGVDDASHRTIKDQTLAFCSTVNGKPYFFQRNNPNSRTADYLDILRNKELYAYLQTLTGKPIPGFGGPAGGFTDKYLGDRDQILTEIFDYIRTVNASDPLVSTPFTPKFLVNGSSSVRTGNPGSGMVVPIKINSTKGFGRIDTLSEAAIVFCASAKYPVVSGSPNGGYPSKLQAFLLLEHFNPAAGPAGYVPNYVLAAGTGGDPISVPISFTVKVHNDTTPAQTLKFPGTQSIEKANAIGYGRFFGGSEGPGPTLLQSGYQLKSPYPYVGEITFPDDYKTKDFPGLAENKVTLDISACNFDVTITTIPTSTGSGEKVQTLHFNFPQMEIPLIKNASDDTLGFAKHVALMMQNPSVDLTVSTDVIRSLEPAGNRGSGPDTRTNQASVVAGSVPEGDYRLLAASEDVPANWFTRNHNYLSNTLQFAHSLRYDDRDGLNVRIARTSPFAGSFYSYPSTSLSANSSNTVTPDFPISIGVAGAGGNGHGALMFNDHLGDWDTGIGNMADGAYINKADEGASGYGGGGGTSSDFPYYGSLQNNNGALFSPNREMPSAVMFGSLSTGVIAKHPWQTLLFHPDYATGNTQHPGKADPQDHLLLDLFEMPIVEPYPISEPLSTAGRVNMNYRIAPFSYITRNTALRAALDPIWIMAIGTDDITYKRASNRQSYRYPVNANETLISFERRFDLNDTSDATKKGVFVSASEICNVPLVPGPAKNGLTVPNNPTNGTMSSWWDNYQRTGDNVREMPYNHLYPLLTTRSNTYTVHYRVQTLRQSFSSSTPSTDVRWSQWDENRDQVLGTYRGSSIIERYVDPSDQTLKDFATNPNASLSDYYKFRVVSARQFAPQ